MHFSAKRRLAIACRLSVRPSVCDVGGQHHHSSVDGNLCFQGYMHAPQSSLKFTKSIACLSETGCDVAVWGDGVGQETAQVAEFVNGRDTW